jgi:MFS family permease
VGQVLRSRASSPAPFHAKHMAVQSLTPELRSSFRHLYADVLWFGVLSGSTMAFLAIYAARRGATSFQVSLLTAGPAVINLLFSLPFGRWIEGRPLIRTSFWSSVGNRLGYLALIPLPWIFSSSLEIWVVVLITLVMSIPGTILAISFNALFADVVPPGWRGEVVGRRNAILSFSMTATSLLCGQLLDNILFPLNYQVVFALGAFGALASSYHLGRLHSPTEPRPRIRQLFHEFARPGFLRFIDTFRMPLGMRFVRRNGSRPLLRPDLLRGSFGPFMLAYFLFYSFQYVPLPLFPLFFVHGLHLTDGAISLGSALFYGMMLAASMRLSFFSDRLGHRGVLVIGAISYGLYPLLIGLAQNATLFWVGSAVGGIIWAFTNGGLVNRLMERVPANDRPAHMTLHNLMLNLGILSGSFAGPLLANWLGLREAILLSVGLRFIGGVLILFWG